MEESNYMDDFESNAKNIQNIAKDLEDELKSGTRLEIIIKKNKTCRKFLIVLLIMSSVTIIGGITALSLAVIQQNAIIELKSNLDSIKCSIHIFRVIFL